MTKMEDSVNRGIKRTVLDNGIVVIAVENPAADIIASRIFLAAGSRWEPRSQAGLAHLLSSVMMKGTDKLSGKEIAEQVESLGASLGADAAADYFLLSMKTVSADFPEMLELAGELLRRASFPETEVELERRMALQGIRLQQEQPFTVAFEQLRQAMYQNHPYAMSGLGTEASVSELTRTDLQEFYHTYFRPDNVVISIVGRISPEDAVAQVQQVFGDWQAPSTPLPTLTLPSITPYPHSTITRQSTQQSIIMLGYIGPSVANPDYAALKLLNTYLGNGLSSRLFVELREKRGLAYEVSAFYPTRLDAAQFAVYMGTAPENTAIALDSLEKEVSRLCKIPLEPEEMQAAQNKLLGQYALGKQTNAQIAQVFGWYEIIGLGIEFDNIFCQSVSAVTSEKALNVAQRYFIEPYVSLVGPAYAVDRVLDPGSQN